MVLQRGIIMKRKVKILAAVFILCTVSGSLYSDTWDQQFCHNAVNNIYLRGDTLWCCTNGGILTYDISDSTFSHFGGELQMRSTRVEVLTFDRDGNVWAGFETHGIARIQNPLAGPELTWYSAETGLIDDRILAIESVGEEVYYGCERGLGKFFQELPSSEAIISDFLEEEAVYDITAMNDSVFWIANSAGITRFNRLSLQYDHFSFDSPVLSVCRHGSSLYCASPDSIYRFDSGSWSFLSGITDVDGDTYTSSFVRLVSGSGRLYCLTEFALYEWTGSWWSAVDRWNMKSVFTERYRSGWSFNLSALEVDGEGNPWIGAVRPEDGRGVNLYVRDMTENVWINRRPEQVTYNDIRKVAPDPEGGVWAAPLTNGISYYSPREGHFSYTEINEGSGEGLSSIHTNLALVCDMQGRLWCHAFGDPVLGSSYPLDMIDLGERTTAGDDVWSYYTRGEEGISIRHHNAVEDPGGNIWFLSDDLYPEEGGWGIDIVSSSGGQWIHLNPDNTPGMPSGNISDCAFSSTRAYLAIKNFGVVVWETGGFDWNNLSGGEGGWYNLITGPSLPNTELSAVGLRGGNLWVATTAGLVKRDSGGDLTVYSTGALDKERRLLNNNIHDIALDGDGKVWVATDNGINVVGGEGTVIASYTSYDRWSSSLSGMYPYSIISPLVSAVCNSICYDQRSDRIWVGTTNGLFGIDTDIAVYAGADLARAILYPNPAVPGEGDSGVYISRISGTVSVEVFNIEGELVHRKENVADGGQIWDLLTMSGFRAESGVYIVRIDDGENYEIRKVAVIR
jgi:ligand-binding sensor domain-containing protein